MGLVALQELPCSLLLFEERMRLSNTLRTLKKSTRGWNTLMPWGLLLEWRKINKYKHGQYAGNYLFRSPLRRVHGAARSRSGVSCAAPLLPPPHFTASLCTARDLKSIETAWHRLLRGLVEKGPCFCWVFTVTNKTQLVQYDRQHWF